jgi:hypothetical protein
MSRPTITRYVQLQSAPATPFTDNSTNRYVPPPASFRAITSFNAHLLSTVYGANYGSRTFASVYVEGDRHVRAQISFTQDFSILVLDHLHNTGQKGQANIGDLVAHFLSVNGVQASSVGLIVIPNIANQSTATAIRQFLAYEGADPGHWAVPGDDHGTTVMSSDLGYTAESVARRLGQEVQRVYLGTLSGNPAFAAALGSSRHTYPPAQARTRPVRPQAKKKSKRNCDCIIC